MVGDQPKSEKNDCYLNQFIVKSMHQYDNIQYQCAAFYLCYNSNYWIRTGQLTHTSQKAAIEVNNINLKVINAKN